MSIKIQHGLFNVTLSEEEVTKLYADQMWMQDVVRILLNPEYYLKSGDIQYSTKEEMMADLLDYFKEYNIPYESPENLKE